MKILTALFVFGVASAVSAADRADLEGTRVIGNRELPKVLYIVPWKKLLPEEAAGPPASSVLDEALSPVDRDVFRREVDYFHGAPSAADKH